MTMPAPRFLGLDATPASPSAHALIAALQGTVEAHEEASGSRTYSRGPAAALALSSAVAAIVGGVMLNAGRDDDPAAWSCQPVHSLAFTGQPVSKRSFDAAMSGLTKAGMIERRQAWTRFAGSFVTERRPSGFRAYPALWSMAAKHGIAGPADAGQHFIRTAPVVPIRINALKPADARGKGRGKPLTVPEGPVADTLRQDVAAMNERLARVPIGGFPQVRLFRGFTEDLDHGGRWYVSGGGYQAMPGDQRRAMLTFDGKPVVEADVSASFLTLLHGLLQRPLPDADPYGAVQGVPRFAVKAWINATIGAGRPVGRWSPDARDAAVKGGNDLSGIKAAAVGDAVLRAFPFLADLPATL